MLWFSWVPVKTTNGINLTKSCGQIPHTVNDICCIFRCSFLKWIDSVISSAKYTHSHCLKITLNSSHLGGAFLSSTYVRNA